MTKDVKLAKPAKKKKIASLDRRKARSGWIFVLPFVIGFVLIYLPIVIDSIIELVITDINFDSSV